MWKRNLTAIKPGEKAIKILAPSPSTVKKQVEKIDPDTQKPVFDKDGKPVTEEKKLLRCVDCLDISQTEKRGTSALTYELTGKSEQYKRIFSLPLEKTSPLLWDLEVIKRRRKRTLQYREKACLHQRGHGRIAEYQDRNP